MGRFPIYIPSKGRADYCITMRTLDAMRVPYRVVVEEQELAKYARALGRERLLVLDPSYRRNYDPCGQFAEHQSLGSGPARNFIWDHAVAEGHAWHWIMDDNIASFHRYNLNLKVPVGDGRCFDAMETFVLRYTNIAMAGPAYFMSVTRKAIHPPYVLNTRIYSCNLIRNDTGYRWRARYNEDTDLSLRMLKDGWCTVQFKAFLQLKLTTQTIPGGNTEAFYAEEGTLNKSRMLAELHPDVARVVKRWGRWHHHVDYRPFKKNLLRRRLDAEITPGVDDFGMRLIYVDDEGRPKA